MNLTAGTPDLAPIGTVGVVGAGFMGAQLALHIAATVTRSLSSTSRRTPWGAHARGA